MTLAADRRLWNQAYLASLEQSGLLRPDGSVPPISRDPRIISLMATLAAGLLAGPAGGELISGNAATGQSALELFDRIRQWYGHDPQLIAPSGSLYGSDLPDLASYDLGLSQPTHLQALRSLCALGAV